MHLYKPFTCIYINSLRYDEVDDQMLIDACTFLCV
jgi:hypothetical protein